MKANRERVVRQFCDLARVKSPLLQVREIMAYLTGLVQGITGVMPQFDEAGKDMPGFECGNMFVNVPATPGCEHLACLAVEAHVDTVAVPKSASIRLVPTSNEDGFIIRTDGTTILGGDDKAGVAAILEALRILKENSVPHSPIQILFTVGEERSMYGVRQMDFSQVKATSVLCLDGFSPDTIWRSCAAKLKYRATVRGREAHGGFPERGLNAILMAVSALASARDRGLMGPEFWGVIRGNSDEESVWHNVSEFLSHEKGGSEFPATNVVPGTVVVCGELRAFRPELLESTFAALKECFEAAVNRTSEDGSAHGSVEFEVERPYPPFCLPEDHPLVQSVAQAMRNAGVDKPRAEIIQGSTHANVFNEHGIPAVVIGTGEREPHTKDEHVVCDEMVQASEVVAHYLAAK